MVQCHSSLFSFLSKNVRKCLLDTNQEICDFPPVSLKSLRASTMLLGKRGRGQDYSSTESTGCQVHSPACFKEPAPSGVPGRVS